MAAAEAALRRAGIAADLGQRGVAASLYATAARLALEDDDFERCGGAAARAGALACRGSKTAAVARQLREVCAKQRGSERLDVDAVPTATLAALRIALDRVGYLSIANCDGDLLCGGGIEERAAAAEAALGGGDADGVAAARLFLTRRTVDASRARDLLGADLARDLVACGLLTALPEEDGGAVLFANAQVWVADREASPCVVVLTDFPSARPSPALGEPVMRATRDEPGRHGRPRGVRAPPPFARNTGT